MGPIWLVDFEDSFTYNIAAEFEALGRPVEVIPWRGLTLPAQTRPGLLVLGPGPGHPDEYPIEEILLAWWKSGVPLGGICLGHQLIARFLGLPVTRSVLPAHGEAFVWRVPAKWRKQHRLPTFVEVQRYNSLAVPARALPRGWSGWEESGEWVAFSHARALSFQFHPESVGTSCPRQFFLPLCELAL